MRKYITNYGYIYYQLLEVTFIIKKNLFIDNTNFTYDF